MDARKVVTGLLVAASAVSLTAVGVYAYKQRRQALLGRGRVVDKPGSRIPMVESVDAGGMTTRHYRAPNITIDQRVRLIQEQVEKSVKDPRVKQIATQITRQCRSRDNLCEAKAIYETVRKRVRYIGDIAPVKMKTGDVEPIDTFQTAYRTWEFAAGDCDDHTILIASLLSVIGLTTRLRVTAPSKWADWAHIYPVVGIPAHDPRKWVALDTTLENPTKFGHELRFGKNRDYKPLLKDVAA